MLDLPIEFAFLFNSSAYHLPSHRSSECTIPSRIDPTGLRLIQHRHLAPRIKPNDQRADPKGPHTARLRVPLLNAGNVLRDILDADRVLDGEAVRLGLEAGLVDEDARVGVEAREGEANVRVDEGDLGGGDARVLKLHGGALLAAENDYIAAFDAYGTCALGWVS